MWVKVVFIQRDLWLITFSLSHEDNFHESSFQRIGTTTVTRLNYVSSLACFYRLVFQLPLLRENVLPPSREKGEYTIFRLILFLFPSPLSRKWMAPTLYTHILVEWKTGLLGNPSGWRETTHELYRAIPNGSSLWSHLSRWINVTGDIPFNFNTLSPYLSSRETKLGRLVHITVTDYFTWDVKGGKDERLEEFVSSFQYWSRLKIRKHEQFSYFLGLDIISINQPSYLKFYYL